MVMLMLMVEGLRSGFDELTLSGSRALPARSSG